MTSWKWSTLSPYVGRFVWLVMAIAGWVLAYGVLWRHGLYTDDYILHTDRIAILLAKVADFPPVGLATTHFTFLIGEFGGRLLAAAATIGSAVLAGTLLYRVLGSRLALVTVILIASVPIVAYEVPLWLSAIRYGIGTCLALVGLHLYYTYSHAQNPPRWEPVVVTVCLALAVLSAEQTVFFVLFLPIFTLVGNRKLSNVQRSRRFSVVTGMIITVVTLLVFGIAIDIVTTMPPPAAGFAAVPELYTSLWQHTISPMQRQIDTTTFDLARDAIFMNGFASFLVTVALSAWVAGLIIGTRQPEDNGRPRVALWLYIAMLTAPILLAMVTVILPGIFVTWQTALAPHLIYVPFIGLVLAIGVGVAWIDNTVPIPALPRVIVGVAGLWFIYSSVIMIGRAQLYVLRFEHDQEQLQGIEDSIPITPLPDDVFYMASFRSYEDFLGNEDPVGAGVLGIFETRWVQQRMLAETLGTDRVRVAAGDSQERPLQVTLPQDATAPFEEVLLFEERVPIEDLIFFQYRPNGRAFVFARVCLLDGSGNSQTVELPLGQQLIENGAPNGDTMMPWRCNTNSG